MSDLITRLRDRIQTLRHDAADWREAADKTGGHAAQRLTLDALANEQLANEWEEAADTLEAQRTKQVELSLRLGQILGPQWDGVPLERMAETLRSLHALIAEWEAKRAGLRTATDDWNAGRRDSLEDCAVQLKARLEPKA